MSQSSNIINIIINIIMVNNHSCSIDFVDGFQTSPPNPSENRLQLRTLRLPLLLPLPAFHLKIRARGNPQP